MPRSMKETWVFRWASVGWTATENSLDPSSCQIDSASVKIERLVGKSALPHDSRLCFSPEDVLNNPGLMLSSDSASAASQATCKVAFSVKGRSQGMLKLSQEGIPVAEDRFEDADLDGWPGHAPPPVGLL